MLSPVSFKGFYTINIHGNKPFSEFTDAQAKELSNTLANKIYGNITIPKFYCPGTNAADRPIHVLYTDGDVDATVLSTLNNIAIDKDSTPELQTAAQNAFDYAANTLGAKISPQAMDTIVARTTANIMRSFKDLFNNR